MRTFTHAVLVGLLVLLVTVTGRAAGVAVQGAVVDPAGIVIPGATVELLSGTRIVAQTVTGTDGGFRFADVPAGAYEIRVTLAGFRQTRTAITVGATAPPALRLKLLVGSVSEVVTVTSDSRPVDSLAPNAAPAFRKRPSLTLLL